jgi:hypothetical protein
MNRMSTRPVISFPLIALAVPPVPGAGRCGD